VFNTFMDLIKSPEATQYFERVRQPSVSIVTGLAPTRDRRRDRQSA
jgi:hypothetical protein